MNIKNKLMLISALLSAVPVIITALLLENVAASKADEALHHSTEGKLVAIRDAKHAQISDYFGTIQKQIRTFSDNKMIVNAMNAFKPAFNQLRPGDDATALQSSLKAYYESQFKPVFLDRNPGFALNLDKLTSMEPRSLEAQRVYLSDNKNAVGEKDKLLDSGDTTNYNTVHKKFHSHIQNYLNEFGYYDIFLVDHASGNIVYSVYKEIDFATSLVNGPYSDSGIAQAFNKVKAAEKNTTYLTEMNPYLPSFNYPAAFISSPIYDGDEMVGVLIFQMPISNINNVMTSNKKWSEVGLGMTGETYLIDAKTKSLSIRREFIENQESLFKKIRQNGVSDSVINDMKRKETTVGIDSVSSDSVKAALNGEKGFHIIENSEGDEVLSAYRPIKVGGHNWALISEITTDEAFESARNLSSSLIQTSIVIAFIIIFIAVVVGQFISRMITSPIEKLSHTINEIESNNDLTIRADVTTNDELGSMGQSFNLMLEKFEALIQQVISSSHQLSTAAEEVSSVAKESASNIDRQRMETEQVATAMNEMSATVQEVTRNATSAADATNTADVEAKTSNQVVQSTMNAINELTNEIKNASNVIKEVESDSEKIGSILDVIKGIAEQTNLLALNAAIEAARAGEQGRGFAVVADEVRTLASRTQQSTTEIEEMIVRLQTGSATAVKAMEKSQEQANISVEQSKEASHSLEVITKSVGVINEMNIQIASASEEQSATTEEMNNNINNISQVAEDNSTGAHQTNMAANQVAELSEQLNRLVQQFKIN